MPPVNVVWRGLGGSDLSDAPSPSSTSAVVAGLGVRTYRAAQPTGAKPDACNTCRPARDFVPPRAGYGTVAFGATDAEVPFAVVPDSLEASKLLRLIFDGWRLRRPSLILSFTGAEEGDALDLSAPVEAALTAGVSEVAQRADAWLISGGFDHGASGLVGRAMAAADGAVPGTAAAATGCGCSGLPCGCACACCGSAWR